MTRPLTSRWLLLIAPILLTLLGVFYGAYPGSPDQYELDYLGWRLIEGDRPYVDFIDENWPGGPWLHAVSTWMFGRNYWSWHAFDYLLLLVATGFLVDLVRRWWSSTHAAVVLVLYPLFYVCGPGTIWFPGQHDLAATHFLFVVLWAHARSLESGRLRWEILTGLAIAAAALVKPTAAGIGPLLGISACLHAVPGTRWRETVRHLAVAGGASVVGIAAGFGALLLQGASVDAVLDCTIVANDSRYRVGALSAAELASGIVDKVLYAWGWIAIYAAFAILASWIDRRSKAGRTGTVRVTFFVTLAITGVISYWIQARGFHYHLGIIFVALTSLAAIGTGYIALWVRRLSPGPVRFALVAVFLVPFLGLGVKIYRYQSPVIPWLLGLRTDEQYFSSFPGGDDIRMSDVFRLTESMSAHVPAGETGLVWGTASTINFLAGIPQPTRFYYFRALFAAKPPFPPADRWNEWFREDLTSRRPHWCFVLRRDPSEDPDVESWHILADFLKDYEVVESFSSADVWIPRRPTLEPTDG